MRAVCAPAIAALLLSGANRAEPQAPARAAPPRIVEDAAPLPLERSRSASFDGSEARLPDDRNAYDDLAGRPVDSFRPRVERAGRYDLRLSSPAIRCELLAFDPAAGIVRQSSDAQGNATLTIEVHDPAFPPLVLVAGPPAARGPYLLGLEIAPVQASSVIGGETAVRTMFDSLNPVDLTRMSSRDPREREAAMEYFRLFTAMFERPDMPVELRAHGACLRSISAHVNGDHAAARAALDEAWMLIEAAGEGAIGPRLEALGVELDLRSERGDLGGARAVLDELLAFTSHPIVPLEVSLGALNDYALFLYEHFDDRTEAARMARRGLDLLLANGIDHPVLEATLRNSLAIALVDGPEAERELRHAIELVRVLAGDHAQVLGTQRVNLANVLRRRGALREARAMLEEALNDLVCNLGWDQPLTCNALAHLSRLKAAEGDPHGALRGLEDASAGLVRWFGPDNPQVRGLRLDAVPLHARIGAIDAAWAGIERVVRQDHERAGAPLAALSIQERLQFQATQRRAVDLALSLPARTAQERALAYQAARLAKGAVARSLDQDRARLRSARSAESEALLADLRATQSALSAAALSGGPDSARLERLRARRDELERKLTRLASTGAVDAGDEPHAVPPAGCALVDFAIHRRHDWTADGTPAREHVVAWVQRADSGTPERIELGPAAPLAEAIEALRSALRPGPARGLVGVEGAAAGWFDFARGLRRAVWDPIEAHLAPGEGVAISPDGFLAGLSFGALPRDDGTFLIEERGFAYLHDPGALASPPARGPSGGGVLLVGGLDYDAGRPATELDPRQPSGWPPLPGSAREIRALDELWRRLPGERMPPRALTGASATETALRAELPRAAIAHIATHGFANPRSDPARTAPDAGAHAAQELSADVHAGLVCSRPAAAAGSEMDTVDDGLLTAAEIGWLDLRATELVVLSACSSGLGRPLPGEGMLGLRRAFRLAGARAVVSALWPVPDDATADLMLGFYEHLWRDGLAPAAALRAAQIDALRADRARGGDGAPHAWGAFVFEGPP